MSVPSKTCFGRTAVSAGSALRISWKGVGSLKWKTAVCSSGVSTFSSVLNTTRPRFCNGFQTSIAEKATSADVKGVSSCHFTPSRKWKVAVSPSSEPFQLVARRGSRPFSPSKEASASGSITLLATKKTPFEATIAGLRLRGSESAATTSRPPFCALSSAAAHRGKSGRATSEVEPTRNALRDAINRAMPLPLKFNSRFSCLHWP